MDLESQDAIRRVVDERPGDNLIVVLGSPDAEGAQVYAETVTLGDPSYAGPLAGVPLGLPVYHILEPAMQERIPEDVFREQVGVMSMALDANEIVAAVREVRERARSEGVLNGDEA